MTESKNLNDDTESMLKTLDVNCLQIANKISKVMQVSSYFQEIDRSNERTLKKLYDYKKF